MSDAGQILSRLDALGLTLPTVAAPVGSYVPAIRVGSTVYTSGQLPFVDGALPATGKVGTGPGLVDPADAAGAMGCATPSDDKEDPWHDWSGSSRRWGRSLR